ncbi:MULTISPECIES: hypothetical protein [unclassified Massilia]|uniref:hypothetical protein n=1 Tax=unclassified Massilia TaxID=2609279 RepID=UPI00177FF2EF|nr:MULTISPECIES: hypothetical protein [unclassified Massilia]MBD8531675.1 hypothetical protein [Massilia sp. CFBP 13647]MBD8675119.1 hypothetical protein [Massilia sp. CFBP 13721]
MLNLTYNDMLSAYEDYPSPIRPYLLRAETHPDIRAKLTKSFMRVFIDLVARTRIRKPKKEISVSVHKLALELGVSTKTVTRTIALCLEYGWLDPDPLHDGRNRWGKFSAKRYLVATPLRKLIGLPTTDEQTSSCGPENPSTPSADETIPTPQSETKMSYGIGVNNCLSKKEASFNNEAEKPKGLPADLWPLKRELGIDLFGIFSLMGLAKQVGQRLQDVWIVKRHLLLNSGITGGRAVKYLRSLLNSGDDFAYVARKLASPLRSARTRATPSQPRSPSTHPHTPSNASNPRLEAIAEACRYKTFRHVSRDMVVRFYDGFAEVTRGAVRETYPACHMEGLYKGVAAGNLVEV